MRLIDADELEKKCLSDIQDNGANIWDIMNNIRRTKTAYDIDKVVKELQESASRYTKKYTTPYRNTGYKDVKAISVNKAIEIVRAGK